MIQERLKKNKITIILLLFLMVAWIVYAVFGHRFIEAMYEGKSIKALNKLITEQSTHPLRYYFEIGDRLFITGNIVAVLSCVFLFLLWSGKTISKRIFILLIIIISLCLTNLFINFRNLDTLLISDDHPKFYSMTVENADLLLKHGTPFGFNHNFQGGIPTFYLRSCFLELIPFSSFFGDRVGYQVMLIFFIVLIPISLFFFILEITKNEDIARVVSFISTFQLGLWPYLWSGMTPAIVAIPLSFLSLLFSLKYFYSKNYYLFPLLLVSGLLAYTHLVVFAITWTFFLIIFLYKLITQRTFSSDLKKLMFFSVLTFLICLPLYYNLLNYLSFFKLDWYYARKKALSGYIFSLFSDPKYIATSIKLFLSILFLLYLSRKTQNYSEKLILRNSLIFSFIILILLLLQNIPKIGIYIFRIWIFIPYIIVFNLSLFLLLRIKRSVRLLGIASLLIITLIQYSPRLYPLETVNTVSKIDNKINTFISSEDFVLFENCAHINPSKNGKKYDECKKGYSHWITYFQKDLGIKCFSNMGEDAHPYNNLRHMYITNGLFRGEPIGEQNKKELITLLKDWSVNKVCVWSPTLKRFFDNSRHFILLGESEKYTCYAATYEILPEVRLSKGGKGRIIDETAFSFTVYLEDIVENQTVTINKNYFKSWSAYNEMGDEIVLKEYNQKICFDTANNDYVYFKYRKRIL